MSQKNVLELYNKFLLIQWLAVLSGPVRYDFILKSHKKIVQPTERNEYFSQKNELCFETKTSVSNIIKYNILNINKSFHKNSF